MAEPLFWTRTLCRLGLARWSRRGAALLAGDAPAVRHLSDRALSVPLDALRDLGDGPLALAADAIDLDPAEPSAELVTRPARGLIDRRDPMGLVELRREVARGYRESRRLNLDADTDVLVTHGATGALHAALDAFVNPGDRVVLFDPTSPLFRAALASRRADVRAVACWTEEGRFRCHLDAFAAAMRGAKMLVLSDPSVPFGACLAPEDLEPIAWWARRLDVLVYLDESLSRFRAPAEGGHLSTLPGGRERALFAGSLGKGYGLGGARVGWLAGDRHLVRAAAVAARVSGGPVGLPAQELALGALRSGEEGTPVLRAELARRCDYVRDRLAALGLPCDAPAGGLSLWVSTAPLGKAGREVARELARDKRVLVTPGDAFGPGGRDFVRVGFAGDEGRTREGLSRLGDWLSGPRAEAETAVEAAVEGVPAISRSAV